MSDSGQSDTEARDRPRPEHERQRDGGQQRAGAPGDAEHEHGQPDGHQRASGPDRREPFLRPGRRRPGHRGGGHRDARDGGRRVAHGGQRQRHVAVGAEEREGQQPAREHGGGQSGPGAQRPGGQQRQQRAQADREPGGDQGTVVSEWAVSPASTAPAPADTRSAAGNRRPPPAARSVAAPGRSAPPTPTSGSRPRKTGRQPARSATSADSAGPTAPGTSQAVDSTANTRGRSASGNVRPMLTYAIAGMAPAPSPCNPRPTTRTAIDGARPLTASPPANSASPRTNGGAGPRRSACSPATTMPTTVPRKKALVTQPYSRRPSRSRATTGRIVTTASASKATRVIVRTRPASRARHRGAHRPAGRAPAGRTSVGRARLTAPCPSPTGPYAAGTYPPPHT